MTRAIRGMNKGRWRIWAVHHGREARNAAALVAIVSLYIAASSFDYRDQIAQAEAARADVAEQLRQERIARSLPRTTYIIEAATPAEAQTKLAQIAGDADAERYRIWAVK